MTDYTAYTGAASMLLPLLIGWVAKWGHGAIVARFHSFRVATDDFRTAIDDIDDTLAQKTDGTPASLQKIITDTQSVVSDAQKL